MKKATKKQTLKDAHAWAAIDHSLRYKREADVPREQKRALFQLSALLELADESFDRLKLQQQTLREGAQDKITNLDEKTLELNSLSYSAYQDSSAILKKLTELAYSVGFEPLDLAQDDFQRDTIFDLSCACTNAGDSDDQPIGCSTSRRQGREGSRPPQAEPTISLRPYLSDQGIVVSLCAVAELAVISEDRKVSPPCTSFISVFVCESSHDYDHD